VHFVELPERSVEYELDKLCLASDNCHPLAQVKQAELKRGEGTCSGICAGTGLTRYALVSYNVSCKNQVASRCLCALLSISTGRKLGRCSAT
jgi:hypothetical protein